MDISKVEEIEDKYLRVILTRLKEKEMNYLIKIKV